MLWILFKYCQRTKFNNKYEEMTGKHFKTNQVTVCLQTHESRDYSCWDRSFLWSQKTRALSREQIVQLRIDARALRDETGRRCCNSWQQLWLKVKDLFLYRWRRAISNWQAPSRLEAVLILISEHIFFWFETVIIIMFFSTVRMRLFFHLLLNLRAQYSENESTDFAENCHKWSTRQGHETVSYGGRRSKAKVTRGRRQIRRPGGGIILDPLGSSRFTNY